MHLSVRPKRVLIVLLAGALGGTFAVSGCGGGEASDANDKTPTKKEFVKKASAACEKAKGEEIAALRNYLDQEPNGNEKKYVERAGQEIAIPFLDGEAEELAAFDPPAGDENEIDAIVAAIEAGVEKAEEAPLDLEKPPGSNPLAEAEKLARAYGLKVCGKV